MSNDQQRAEIEAEAEAARARIEELEGKCERQGQNIGALFKQRCLAEARCEGIRAETIAEVVEWLHHGAHRRGAMYYAGFDVSADAIERHFAAPHARNDEHGTRNDETQEEQ